MNAHTFQRYTLTLGIHLSRGTYFLNGYTFRTFTHQHPYLAPLVDPYFTASSHGASFYGVASHGAIFHGATLYGTIIRVTGFYGTIVHGTIIHSAGFLRYRHSTVPAYRKM